MIRYFILFIVAAFGFQSFLNAQVLKGINQMLPITEADVKGNATIGSTYSGIQAAPSSGLILEGNTGIGMHNPISRLGIYSATGSWGWLQESGLTQFGVKHENEGTYLGSLGNHRIELLAEDTSYLTINPNGNVGVGTSGTAAKLQVLESVLGYNALDDYKYYLFGYATGSFARVHGQNGGPLNSIGSGSTSNTITIWTGSSGRLTARTQYSTNDPSLMVWGQSGTQNVQLHTPYNYSNNGLAYVYDQFSAIQCGLWVDASNLGNVWGDLKTFVADNPDEPGTEIWYASIEGPESAAYFRGTAELKNGKATILFPDHFRSTISSMNMTIKVTPLSDESSGLCVIEKHTDKIIVAELKKGRGSYAFDFMISSVRNKFEDFEVIRKRRKPINYKAPEESVSH